VHLGANHGTLKIVLARGQVQGDVVTGFLGAGQRGGDMLELNGYGPRAALKAVGDGLFQVRTSDGFSETFTLSGVAKLASHDFVWT
jgi:hypothetical protein